MAKYHEFSVISLSELAVENKNVFLLLSERANFFEPNLLTFQKLFRAKLLQLYNNNSTWTCCEDLQISQIFNEITIG